MMRQSDKLRIDNQLCFPLYACAKEIVRQYRKPLEPLNLTYTQYIVMMVLWEHVSLAEWELGQKVHLDSGTLAPLLKRLENQGYISRTRMKDDERCLLISLTQRGREIKEKALKVPDLMRGCIPLAPKELIQLKTLLDKALRNWKKEKKNDNKSS